MADAALAAGETCNRCGRDYRMWAASSPLWNAVMRGGCINGPWEFGEMLCANCFMEMAEDRGVARNFRVVADDVLVPLQTVTPSGRVWNEKRKLWIEQGRSAARVVAHPKRRTIEVRKPMTHPSLPVVDDGLLPFDEETLILLMLGELHANVPEADRPMSMSDLSDDQANRARNAVRKVLVASMMSAPAGRFASIAELERELATRPTPSVVTDDGLVERRFFIDHGMIHDRVTGKHVSTGPIEFGEGQLDHSPVTETCELLNSLAASDRDVLVRRIAELEALISERSIERLAKDIAVAVVDPMHVRETRHSAMVRLGERLRNPLPNDLAALIPLEEEL